MSLQYVAIVRKVSAPTLCPACRGRPRFFAQRPLPSMMTAICRGTGRSATGVFFFFRVNRPKLLPPCKGAAIPPPPNLFYCNGNYCFSVRRRIAPVARPSNPETGTYRRCRSICDPIPYKSPALPGFYSPASGHVSRTALAVQGRGGYRKKFLRNFFRI